MADHPNQALATNPNSYLALALYPANTIYEDEAPAYNYL